MNIKTVFLEDIWHTKAHQGSWYVWLVVFAVVFGFAVVVCYYLRLNLL